MGLSFLRIARKTVLNYGTIIAANVRQCLAGGVSPNSVNNDRETALEYAALQGRLPIVLLILDAGAQKDTLPMIEAALPNETEVLEYFLEQGGDPNSTDERGHTPLMEAAGWCNETAVRLLIRYGADPQQHNYAGFVAEQYARQQNCLALADYLKQLSKAVL